MAENYVTDHLKHLNPSLPKRSSLVAEDSYVHIVSVPDDSDKP